METTTTLSDNLHSFYDKRLLESAEAQLRLAPLAMDKMHQKGSGTDYFLLRYGNFSEDLSELTQGVVPSESTIDTNKYTVAMKQYGRYVVLADLLLTTAIDPVLEDVADRLGYDAAVSTDKLIRNDLVTNATTNTQYVGSGNTTDDNISDNETFTAPEVIKGIRALRGFDAAPYKDGLYRWVVHPFISIDIMADTAAGGFIELNKYVAGLADGPLNGEVGKVYGARLLESTVISAVENSGVVDVYRTLLFARDAFCMTKFDRNHIRMIIKQLGTGGTSDPLDQIATAGYKMQLGLKYLGGSFSNHNLASPDTCIQIRGAATSV